MQWVKKLKEAKKHLKLKLEVKIILFPSGMLLQMTNLFLNYLQTPQTLYDITSWTSFNDDLLQVDPGARCSSWQDCTRNALVLVNYNSRECRILQSEQINSGKPQGKKKRKSREKTANDPVYRTTRFKLNLMERRIKIHIICYF